MSAVHIAAAFSHGGDSSQRWLRSTESHSPVARCNRFGNQGRPSAEPKGFFSAPPGPDKTRRAGMHKAREVHRTGDRKHSLQTSWLQTTSVDRRRKNI